MWEDFIITQAFATILFLVQKNPKKAAKFKAVLKKLHDAIEAAGLA